MTCHRFTLDMGDGKRASGVVRGRARVPGLVEVLTWKDWRRGLSLHLVVRVGLKHWIVPAIPGGWSCRSESYFSPDDLRPLNGRDGPPPKGGWIEVLEVPFGVRQSTERQPEQQELTLSPGSHRWEP